MNENLDEEAKRLKIENEDKREDSMRKMSWFTLIGMLLYPALIVFCDIYGLKLAITILGSLAETYFITTSGIISVFFGSSAYIKKHDKTNHE